MCLRSLFRSSHQICFFSRTHISQLSFIAPLAAVFLQKWFMFHHHSLFPALVRCIKTTVLIIILRLSLSLFLLFPIPTSVLLHSIFKNLIKMFLTILALTIFLQKLLSSPFFLCDCSLHFSGTECGKFFTSTTANRKTKRLLPLTKLDRQRLPRISDY